MNRDGWGGLRSFSMGSVSLRRPGSTGRTSRLADHLDRRPGRWRSTARPAALRDHHQPVADLEQLVELLADHQQRAAGRAAFQQPRRGSAPPRPRPRPRSAARRSAARARRRSRGPTMNFCRLPPDSELVAAASGPPALTLKRGSGLGQRRHLGAADPAAAVDRAGAREQRVCGKRQRRHRAAAEAFLGHEVQALLAPPARRIVGDVLAEEPDRAGRRAQVLAESAAISSCWPLPETPAMPTISPARTSKPMSDKAVAKGSAWAPGPDRQHRAAAQPGLDVLQLRAARRRSSGATGWRWSPASGRPRR